MSSTSTTGSRIGTSTDATGTAEARTPLRPTAGQTVGPFFRYGLDYLGGNELVPPHSPGAVLLSGTLYDAAGAIVPDGLIEIWQGDADGAIPAASGSLHRDGHTFTGFGRAATDDEGVYRLWTLEPGTVDAGRRPFIAVAVFARGLLDALHTRIYLPESHGEDALLAGLSEAEGATLVATRTPEGWLHHDIRLGGEQETIFLAFV